MPSIPSLRSRLRLLLDGEQGMALPVALFAMIAGMALASAAVVATVNVQQGEHRDSSTKSAIAVADAGANIARMRIDRYAAVLATKPCLQIGTGGMLEGTTAGTDGWCPAVEGSVGGGRYVYRVSPAGSTCGAYKLCVVATGTVGEVSRRIEVAYNESAVTEDITTKTEGTENTGTKTEGTTGTSGSVGFEGVIGLEGIELGGNAEIHVGIGTNGNVTGVGNAVVCGDIRHGIGKTWTHTGNAKQCEKNVVTEGNKALPPVTSFMPSNLATVNSNYRLYQCTKTKPTKEPTGCELDTYSVEKGNASRTATKPWNPSTRAISLEANSTLTVSGGDYWICSLSVSGNAQLIMAASAQVRFFFDTPEHCGQAAGTAQISLTGNSRIASTNKTVMPAFYLLGSATTPTSVSLGGNANTEDEFVIYGPDTTVNIPGNAIYKGVIAGKQVNVTGNGHIENSSTYEPPAEIRPVTETKESSEGKTTTGTTKTETITTARYYSPQFYVECIGVPAPNAAPNASC
jgi:hypothetical protein